MAPPSSTSGSADARSEDARLPLGSTLKSQTVVRNTFLEFRDTDSYSEGSGSMRRSASDSDLSRAEYRSINSLSSPVPQIIQTPPLLDSSCSSESTTRPCSTNSRDSSAVNTDRGKRSGLRSPGYHDGFPRPAGMDISPAMQINDQVASSLQDGEGDVQIAFLVNSLHFELNEPLDVLESLAEQGILHKIPRDANGQITSMGSIDHWDTDGSVEQCNPCVFWFKNRCTKGIRCHYCHFRHKGQKSKRLRASKHARQRMLEMEKPDNQDLDDDEVSSDRPTQNSCDEGTVAPGPIRTQSYTARPQVPGSMLGAQGGPRTVLPAESPWQSTRIAL